jgi:hypothetical protein
MWVRRNIPLDGEACYTRLLCQNLPLHFLDDRLCWRLQRQCLVCVLVVHIVAHAHKLAVFVATAEQNHCDADDLAVGDARQIRGVCAEDKFVDANGEGSDENRIELLVVLVPNINQ